MSLSTAHPSAIGKVYFIRRSDAQSVKIGFTHGAVEKRLRTLQLSNSAPLTVMRSLRGTRTHEADWHRRYPHLRQQGEWFALDNELTSRIFAYSEGSDSPDGSALFADIEATHPLAVLDWCHRRGMNIDMLADALGYARTYIPEYFRDRATRMSPQMALAIEVMTQGEITALSLLAHAVSA